MESLTLVMNNLRAAFENMKGSEGDDPPPTLPVVMPNGSAVAILRALVPEDADNPDLVRDLTDWRRQFMDYFLSRFSPTEVRTQNRLRELSVDANRIFFLIYTQDGELVGHYALIVHDEKTVEVDNSILGARPPVRGLMVHTEHALLQWVFQNSPDARVIANLLQHNVTCFMMHRATGFSLVGTTNLRETVADNGDRLLRPVTDGNVDEKDACLLTLELDSRAYWLARNEAGYP